MPEPRWRFDSRLTALLLLPLLAACPSDTPTQVSDTEASTGAVTTGGVGADTLGGSNSSAPATSVADETSATGGTSGDSADCCSPHPGSGCEDPDTATCVCEQEAFCCAFDWDQTCADLAEACGGCTETTTDDPTDPGTTGGGEDSPCCDPSDAPGCAADPRLETCVCKADDFCCNMAWDEKCVGVAVGECGLTCDGGGDDGPPPTGGDCCAGNGSPGCDDMTVQDCVCALDSYCCTDEWDGICAAEAQYECGNDCGLPPPGGDCCAPHDAPGCDIPEINDCVCDESNFCCLFPWSDDCIGIGVEECGAECPDWVPPDPCCDNNPGPGCGNEELETCVCMTNPGCCGMNWGPGCVEAAQVECGYSCYDPGTEDCCSEHPEVGCNVPEIQSCVCGLDPFCCEDSWDGQCVNEATNDCGGCMGPVGP